MRLNLFQRLLLAAGVVAMVYTVFVSPPLIRLGVADARAHCEKVVRSSQDAWLMEEHKRMDANGGNIIVGDIMTDPFFDAMRIRQDCLADANVDNPRLALNLLAVALITLALVLVAAALSSVK